MNAAAAFIAGVVVGLFLTWAGRKLSRIEALELARIAFHRAEGWKKTVKFLEADLAEKNEETVQTAKSAAAL